MESEVESLLAALAPAEPAGGEPYDSIPNMRRGILGGIPVVIARCGVGMVNAASTTQRMIDSHDVAAIVNTGVAGSLISGISIGDVVVARGAVNWEMDVRNFGYAPGQTPGSPSALIRTSDKMAAIAEAAARSIGMHPHSGIVASSDKFVRDQFERAAIAGVFDAACCEMEGAAIAQVCDMNDIPCSIIRTISDTSDGQGAEDYPRFEAEAAAASSRLVMAFLGELGKEDLPVPNMGHERSVGQESERGR